MGECYRAVATSVGAGERHGRRVVADSMRGKDPEMSCPCKGSGTPETTEHADIAANFNWNSSRVSRRHGGSRGKMEWNYRPAFVCFAKKAKMSGAPVVSTLP